MLYTLKNDRMTVTVNSRGAELWSLVRDGNEYLWQGDERYWSGRAPVLFPICGRLYDGKYRYAGKEYTLPIHGFAKDSEFAVRATEDALICTLEANDATREVYPFDFCLTIVYRLKNDRTLRVESTVSNRGGETLPFSYGAHPGFRVPLRDADCFEDCYLRFAGGTVPRRLVFSDTCFQTGRTAEFPLMDGDLLLLRHDLFDRDAIFLENTGGRVLLNTKNHTREVSVRFADFPYLGIWHRPHTDAPYVCIEPWAGLPSRDGKVDDFATKDAMLHLGAGEEKTLTYEISVR